MNFFDLVYSVVWDSHSNYLVELWAFLIIRFYLANLLMQQFQRLLQLQL